MTINEATVTIATNDVQFDVINHIGLVTLNRPKAHNALTHQMVLMLTERMAAWKLDPRIRGVVLRGAGGKAFCAGGDIRALYQSYQEKTALYREFFVDEYRLDYMIHRYPKPCVAIMDGLVMGGGMGLAQGATLRLVSTRSQIAMPETAIGLFPDVGASHFLSRMPIELALYLGISGITIQAADAIFFGLADCYISENCISELESRLESITWKHDPETKLRNALCSEHTADPGHPPTRAFMPAVLGHFNPAFSVQQMVSSLTSETEPAYKAWANKTAETLQTRSPLMMCVAREQLLRGRGAGLANCFRMELGLVHRTFDQGDAIEGIRALIVDKDRTPVWHATTLSSVRDDMVDALFDSPWDASIHPLAALV